MYLTTWITTHLPTSEGWMAELAMRDYFDDGVLLLKVSGLCSTHTDHDGKIQNTQNPTDSKMAHSLPGSNNKRV